MNDRFLFRGKRLDNGEWVVGYYVGPAKGCNISEICDINTLMCDAFEIEPSTVGQCTGLKDKNGKLIFEGDIFKTIVGWIAVVEWDDENARFLGFSIEGKRRIIYVDREPKAEIIGNIHDNPELMEIK